MSKDLISDYSSTAASNEDVGGVNIAEGCDFGNMNNMGREIMSHLADHFAQDTLASASATSMPSTAAHYVNITGTTTITGFGTVKAGTLKFVKFAGALQLTHNGTSFILPGAANITTVAGDTAVFTSEGSGNWRCLAYYRAAALPLTTLLDEDDMSSDSAAAPPSQQSVKAFVEDETRGQQTMWVPASAMTPRTTAGAAAGTLVTGNFDIPYLAYDASSNETSEVWVQMPKSWDGGTFIVQFLWTHPATTTNFDVMWNVAAVSLADGDALSTAYGTARTVVDTGGTTSAVYISDEISPAVTPAGTPAGEQLVRVAIGRSASNVSDTLAVDAYLIGVKIHYTTNAATDD